MLRSILVATAILSGSPVLATSTDADQAPSLRVSYADLDLNAAAGRATLDRRVGHAIREVCPEPGSDEPSRIAEMMTCRRMARHRAAVQIARAVESSQTTQLAIAGR